MKLSTLINKLQKAQAEIDKLKDDHLGELNASVRNILAPELTEALNKLAEWMKVNDKTK